MDWNSLKRDFKRHLLFERGLAENSISAYLNDVQKLQSFAELRLLHPSNISTKDLQDFLLWVNEFSISSYTKAASYPASKPSITLCNWSIIWRIIQQNY